MNENIRNQTSKTIVRNVIYGSMTWFLPLGLSFIATPVIVRSLGNNDYGIYALVLGFIGYSFTFSLGRAITKYIAQYRVSGESEKISGIISASFILNIVVGLTGVLSICLLANWLVRDVFNIDADARDKTVVAMYIASGIIFLSMLNQVFSSVLQGIQRFDVYSKIFTANSFALISGNLVLAYFGYGLLALLGWNLLVLFVSSIVFGFAAKRLLPEFRIRIRVEPETMRLVLRYSAGIIGTQLLANLLLLFERGWITQRLGTENLTYYVVPLSLGMQLQAFISSLVLVVFPLASELTNDREKLLRLYRKATKVIAILIIFLVATVAVHSRPFLFLWMGESFSQHSSGLLIIHMTCFGVISMMSISWQMTEGLGFPQFNALTTGICTVLTIFLMVVLTGDYGNEGAALARLAGFATAFLSIFIVERWFFKKVQVRFWLGMLSILGAAAISSALAQYLINSLLPLNWLSFFLSVISGGLVYCFVLWLLDFITSDEKLLIKRVFSR